MSEVLRKPWFAFISLLLVLASGVAWISIPKFGIWFTLLALIPWVLRWLIGKFPFQRTPFDWFLVIFLITAWVGYWAAYDKTTAWIKVWLIVTAVLLYYSISAQPKENFNALSLLSFCIGLGVSSYFFLTHDFTHVSGSLVHWWMNHRPEFGWHAIHHGYISGLLVITNMFAAYWLWNTVRRPLNGSNLVLKLFLIIGLGLNLLAFLLTMSRGIWAATACGFGVWILWKVINSSRFAAKGKIRSLFPILVLVYLSAIVLFVYLGPAQSNEDSGQSDYGRNSRAEVFERGTYFLRDYLFTGAGLNSFPGLYSEYILSIPYFYFVNSYNLFLDVAIEQGLMGGLALIFVYIGCIWLVSRAILKAQSTETRWISWLSLLVLIVTIIHGLFYDYLYYSNITMLLLFPIGFSTLAMKELNLVRDEPVYVSELFPTLSKQNYPKFIVFALALFVILAFNFNKVISLWYANLGSVQMSQVELRNFPKNEWATKEIVSQLKPAETSFHSALRYDPNNETANYRLGMISMLRQDFDSASKDLELAHSEVPNYRGITKNLGYSYLWLGEMNKAQSLLAEIPEAAGELNVYVWWWGAQQRFDLAHQAFQMLTRLKAYTSAQ